MQRKMREKNLIQQHNEKKNPIILLFLFNFGETK